MKETTSQTIHSVLGNLEEILKRAENIYDSVDEKYKAELDSICDNAEGAIFSLEDLLNSGDQK